MDKKKLNANVKKFIDNRLGLTDDDLVLLSKIDATTIKSSEDINPIIDANRINENNTTDTKVSVADILGYDYKEKELSDDIFENLGHFFDESGRDYQKRSLSMLDYSTAEVLENLKPSFAKEPIRLDESDEGVYVVNGNGFHRFHVIKAHYLKELAKMEMKYKKMLDEIKQKYKSDVDKKEKLEKEIEQQEYQELQALRKKYEIDVTVNRINYAKTYSAYILKKIADDKNVDLQVYKEYKNGEYTDGVTIDINDGKRKITYEDEKTFLTITKTYFDKYLDELDKTNQNTLYNFLTEIKEMCAQYPSFEKYVNTNLKINSYLENLDSLNKGNSV